MSKSEVSLGSLLRAKFKAEEDEARTANETLRRLQEAAAARELAIVQSFFDRSWEFFEKGIRSGLPTADLSIMVGSEFRGKSDNVEAANLMCRWPNATNNSPQVTIPSHHYYQQWKIFQNKCHRNGLEPVWVYHWDGGGMSSWWRLNIEPLEHL